MSKIRDSDNRVGSFTPFSIAALCVCLFLIGTALAAPLITLSKKTGPPTSKILVSGRGFEPNAGVDIFFDTKDEALVVTDGKGNFHDAKIHAPSSAFPGKHWVTGLERNNDKGDQEPFIVNTNWPQFLRDNAHTGLDPYENVLNLKNASRLTLKWTQPSGNDDSSAAVVDGVVYAAASGDLRAFNAITGNLLWKYQTQAGIYTSPTIANHVVYFGTDSGYVYALDARNGTLLWSYLAPSLVRSSPTVANGTIYFGCWNGSFFALNARTGTLLWEFTSGNTVESTPSIVDGKVYFGSDDGNLYVVDAITGALLWKYATLSEVVSAPAIANGVVYFGSFQSLYALDANTGSLLWNVNIGSFIYSSPVVAHNVVYLAGWDQHLYALRADSGVLVWKTLIGPGSLCSPVLANGVLYAPAQNSLSALNDATGDILWTSAETSNNASSPAVANGMLFLDSELYLYAFGLSGARTVNTATSRPPARATLHPDLKFQPSSSKALAAR